MEYKKQVQEFSDKWIEKFRDNNINYLKLIEEELGNDCAKLDFEMDCGNAFSEKYDGAFNDVNILKKVIDDVDDLLLLGSAIYSKWRYYNHWAYSGEDILESQNREWFILALERLKKLV